MVKQLHITFICKEPDLFFQVILYSFFVLKSWKLRARDVISLRINNPVLISLLHIGFILTSYLYSILLFFKVLTVPLLVFDHDAVGT